MGLCWADGYTNAELGEHRAVFREPLFILPIDILSVTGGELKTNEVDGNFTNTGWSFLHCPKCSYLKTSEGDA